jgi:hypothetical protein
VETLDDFYGRGSLRLRLASRDRELEPPLHGFLSAVEAGVEALVRAALATSGEPDRAVRVAITLTSFPVRVRASRLAEVRARGVEAQAAAMRARRGAAGVAENPPSWSNFAKPFRTNGAGPCG